MQELHLTISSDEMTVCLDVPRMTSNRPSMNILQTLLRRHHVVFGTDEETLRKISNGSLYGKCIPVATGRNAKPSSDGSLEWLIGNEWDRKRDAPGASLPQEPHSLVRVNKGKKILRVVSPKAGIHGVTVTGKQITVSEPKEIDIIAGTGTIKENDVILALHDGAVKFDGSKIEICSVKEIPGDIDPAAGIVEFTGALKIEGSLRPGAKVHASEDIYISRNVEDAEIKGGGSVIIEGDAVGSGSGTVECRNSLYVNNVSQCTLKAGKDISVSGVTTNSIITADGNVILKKLAGGTVSAFSIQVAAAGKSDKGKAVLDITRIKQLLKERYGLLRQYGKIASEKAGMADDLYVFVKGRMNPKGYLDDKDGDVYESKKQRYIAINRTALSIQQRLSYLEELEKEREGQSYIKADVLLPGTVVKTMKEERLVEHEERNVVFNV